ncbi:uncharacterized protein FOBCDRAFT_207508 [Fusarium oxysporum Fo47]|uniref:uncharacterized protein n=1 Tax=Fusarium oxysporum Fo47 TaxID=660027 RepID=UPI002869A3E9|nr:uncharacterized protein FOBCDRAFT_207508 [Fusarium oxysporum Fo47]QKD60789.2 hypothetical protein FOBCDRAFT_207508 [Fusarium oxysporum Fo47]
MIAINTKVLLLAIGLLVADSALASPYKPRSSIGSTTQPTSTVEETPTVASSETSTETGAITMTAPDTTAASEAETTTAVESTTTTAEAESTTTTTVALYKARPSQASTKMICAYYGSANTIFDPANFAFCQNGNTGPNTAFDYMTCQIVSGKLSCTAPQAACPTDDDGVSLGCTTVDGQLNNEFYYKTQPGLGTYLYISSGSPNGYTPVNVIAQEA